MDPYRLPRTVVPSRYDLRLEPDLLTARFTGQVTIAVDVREGVSEIVLNAAELDVQGATLSDANGKSRSASIGLEPETERCRLRVPEPLTPGVYRLHLVFQGILNDKLRGFYRSTYKDAGGAPRFLAATQFEATDARRAFPCWDEPAFKAVFNTTLVIDPAFVAVSNTGIASEHVRDGKKVVSFADTIPMSTYLLAFVVGDLEATEPVLVGGTPLKVWCVPGKKCLTRFAQEIGAFSLKLYEDYYGQPYPGDKLDLISIPDFAAGAMENLGAITFRETALLVDEATATHSELERVADVVAHENAHMWFGDLVTMAWWNGLWLNEAFATFLEMVAVDAWKPEWQRWTTFGVSRAAALLVDGLQSTRPIEFPVAAPKDADAMFDVLTYEKGASILRMLEQYLGADVFRNGVREYLRKHAYGNTETGDLWIALAAASGQQIPQIMDGWIFRPGYPLITAKTEGGQLVLSQQRFSYLKDNETASAQLWHVPIQIRVRSGGVWRSQRLLLADGETHLPLPAGFESVLINEQGHGFYRVSYAQELLDRLIGQLDQLAAIERFNLVNDAWAAVLAGLLPLTAYLDLTTRFRTERDKNVWAILIGSFYTLNRILEPADRPWLAQFIRASVGAALRELGPASAKDDELIRQLRGDLMRTVGTLGDDRAMQEQSRDYFQKSLNSSTALDANLVAAAISVLAFIGDANRYDDFLQRFRSAKTPQEEQRFLYALAGFRLPELIAQTLARTLNGEIRTQDAPFVLRALLMGVSSREAAWGFIKANWEQMSRSYPENGKRRLFEGVTGLASAAWEKDIHAFLAEKKIDLGGKTLQQYLEQLRIVVSLREREGAALHAYLARFAQA